VTAPAAVGDGLVADAGRPSVGRLVWQQIRYANTGYWRTPIAAFFTLAFPLIFLLLIGALAGNAVIDESSGLRLAQFLTPAMAVFGTASAAFTTLAITVATDRDARILKRLRGTPLPAWAYLAGRIIFTSAVALTSVAIVVAVAVAFYGVEIVWAKAPAALLTLLVGIVCLSSLGMALAALVQKGEVVSAVANGILIPLAFISGIFTSGQLPAWLERISSALPLRPYFEALSGTFNPFEPGAGFAWAQLGVLLAWSAVGVFVAARWFRWENRGPAGAPRPAAAAPTAAATVTAATVTAAAPAQGQLGEVEQAGRPRIVALLAAQIRHASRTFWRSRAGAFFSVGFPIVLLLIIPQVFTGPGQDLGEVAQVVTPAMATYGLAASTYLFLSSIVARARERGILKRVHGTPVPVGVAIAGQVAAAVGMALVSLALVTATGTAVYGVEIVWRKLPALLVYVALGVGCFAALGIALASLAPNEKAADTLANVTLLPLAFVSDIFIIGDLPGWLGAVGWIFPLKHLSNGVAATFDPAAAGLGWELSHLGALLAWLVVGLVLAARFFSWAPSRGGAD
jgi:ABC-2 type transport system permease protein